MEGVEAERLYNHGTALAGRGDLVRAEQYIVAAIERGYSREEALPTLLQVCVAGQRHAAALRHAEPYLRDHPDNWSLRYVVATLHLGLGRVSRAQSELEQVIEDAPQEANPYYTLGTMYRDQMQDEEEATRWFNRYLELAPRGDHAAEVRRWLDQRHEQPEIIRLPPHETPPEGSVEGDVT
ncbi:MAG: tetratricopeptide repeat protein [Myxococcota bacterium]